MAIEKPSVFIGSSREGLDVAREVELHLQDDATPTIWKYGVFGLGSGTLETLMNALDRFDFAVMVLSKDDLLESRDKSYTAPRDNVILELGLFMGRLGRERTFIVHEEDPNLKIPSDLAGITLSPYHKREDHNMTAALSPTCTQIIKAIRTLGASEQLGAVAREQQEQMSIIEQHQEFFDIVKYSVSSFCYATLWHIENGPEYVYNNEDSNMQRRMWFLVDSGYIEPREPNSFLVFDGRLHKQDLRKVAKLTPIGKYLVNLRGKP